MNIFMHVRGGLYLQVNVFWGSGCGQIKIKYLWLSGERSEFCRTMLFPGKTTRTHALECTEIPAFIQTRRALLGSDFKF